MNKQNFLTRMLLLLALIVGSVNGAWGADTFKKVTSASEIAAGKKYILVCESKNVAMKNYASGTYCAGVGVTINDNKVIAVDGINVLTIETGTGGWYFKQENGNYLYSSAAKNLKAENATSKTLCTITDDYQISMGSSGNLQYNASSPRFCPYTSSQTAAYLYVKEDASALSSIAVSGTYQTVFHQGDEFNHDGIVVTATYSNGTNADVTSNATFTGYDMDVTGNQTVTVSYTENAVTKTATYSIKVNAPATLTSIALSGTYQTTFTQGDSFNYDGLVVTANYDDETSAIVTEDAIVTTPDLSTTGSKTVTVSYTQNTVTKTATYNVTVNEYVQPLIVNIALNNSFFGTSFTGSNAKGSGNHSATTDGITVNFKSGGDKNNFYINDSEIRAYSGNTLEFVAPTGYVITKIEFTNAWATGTTVDEGSLNDTRIIWTNAAGSSSVDFTPTSKSTITTLTIYLAEPVEVTAAGLATYVSDYDLDYTGKSISAYIAKEEAGKIKMYQVNKVPAGTGVLLKADGGATVDIPVTTEATDDVTGNLFKRGNDEAVANGSNPYNYILNNIGGTVGFYRANMQTVAKNRAYLQTTIDAPATGRLSIFFDDEGGEATGIIEVKDVKAADAIFNLNGVRVKNMTKGLYIVNGKKMIVK